MHKHNMLRKGLVFAVIVLFAGIAVAPSINADVGKASVNRSPYTPHDPIYINGNDDFTSENGVTGGSGSSNDPFVIEDWEIEASSMDGITIRNVSVYFTIRNCYVHDGGINNDGIVFINVTNGVIEDTIITGNRNGVIFRTQYPGKENSENNIIRYNNITSNTYDGIHFEHTGWGYHSNNVITHNNLSGNNRGIYMIMSAYNHIVSNNIMSNIEVGILLDMCEGGGESNIIYHNNFINNGDNQAFERGDPYNRWDDGYPSGGNYWSDYSGVDNYSGPGQNISGSDGIGDTPYYIPGGNNKDRYPLMEPWGSLNLPPSAPWIDGPKCGRPRTYRYTLKPGTYNYTFKAIDPNGDDVYYWIEWGDGTHEEWFGPYASGEEVIRDHTWDKKGTYTIRAKAKDIHGAEGPWGTLWVWFSEGRQMINLLFLRFLQNHPNLFPILRYILGLQ